MMEQISYALFAVGVLCGGGVASAAAPMRFAVIVANNESLDPELAPLSFADDDAAKWHTLFRAAGAETWLLTVLDPETARLFPEAVAASRPPNRREFMAAVDDARAAMAEAAATGREVHFYLVYSGHGNVSANREGYLTLLDSRLRRSELYHEILARSPASFNHLIIDACQAYFFVHKRGDGPDKRGDYRQVLYDFLRSEELASYPNTGVILAASRESKTHEWSAWRSGLFSHEMRSALLGAADADEDGHVTYSEAAACVEAANAAVDDPAARLRVYYREPAARTDVALLDREALGHVPTLDVDRGFARHYHVQDDRGVRVADFHITESLSIRLALLGQPPFFVRSEEGEAPIPIGPGPFSMERLRFVRQAWADKGSLDRTFRRHLYRFPFGRGFLEGTRVAGIHHVPPVDLPAPRLRSGGEPILVLPLVARGADPALANNLSTVLVETTGRAGGYTVTDPASSSEADAGTVACIRELTCVPEESLPADKVLTGSIGRIGDTHQVTLRLLEPRRRRELERRTETFHGRPDKLVHAVRFLTEAILGAGSPTGQLALSIPVSGAEVVLDGTVIGTTPLAGLLTVPTGRHQLIVRAPGRRAFADEVVISSGTPLDLSVELEKETPFLLRPLAGSGAAALAGAAGGLAAGIAFYMAASDTHADYLAATDLVRMGELRRQSQEELRSANTWFVASGALAALGATLFVIEATRDGDKDETLVVTAAPTGSGAAISLLGIW